MSDQQQGDILLHLGRLEGKMDAVLGSQARHEIVLNSHDEQLRTLQNASARMMGVAAGVGGLAGLIVTVLGLVLHK